MKPPGDWLRRVARRFCDDSAIERVIDPVIADLKWEDSEHEASGRWRRHFVRTRAYVAFWCTLILHLWSRTRLLGAEDRAEVTSQARRIAFGSAGTACVLSALLVAPGFAVLQREEALQGATATDWAQILLFMIPQSLTVTIPLGLLIGATMLAGTRRMRHRWIAIALVAGCCSATTVVMLEWVLPPSNRAFRVVAGRLIAAQTGEHVQWREWGRPVREWERPVSELDLHEFGERLKYLQEFQQFNLPLKRYELGMLMDYYFRVSLTVTPIVFGLLAVGLSSITRRRILGAAFAVLAVVLWWSSGSAVRRLVYDGTLSPLVAVWLPNIASVLLALVAIAIAVVRTKRGRVASGTV